MDINQRRFDIIEGAEVIGSDGEKLGKVDHLEGDTIVVRKGFFFPQDHHIPMSAVTNVEGDNVHLAVTSDAALAQEWGEQTNVAGSAPVMPDVGDDMNVDPQPFDHEQDSQRTHVNGDEDLTVPVVEEELGARVRDVDRGEVRIHKDVVEEQQTLEVPVTEEEVEISRRRVDRPVSDSDHVFEEGTMEIPVRGEDVDVQKRARVTEEIDIDKTARQHTEQVSDTVKREEVRIEGDEGLDREVRPQDRDNDKF